jgi:GntR family transcriptional regulator
MARNRQPKEAAAVADPMYRTIAQDLLEKIQSGAVRPGDQLPTELELRDKYSASRNTIRDAVKWLATRGLVETKPGQGTFAAQRIEPFVTTLSADPKTGLSGMEGAGWLGEVRAGGRIPMASVPRVEVRVAPRSIADLLHVPAGAQVLTRQQKQYIDRTPWSVQTTAYPFEFVERGATRLLMAEDIAEGAVAYLDQTLGLREVGHRDTLLVRSPHEDEGTFFKLPDDGRVSVVTVVRTGYRDGAEGPVPFRVTFTVFPADRNQLVINFGDVPAELPGPAEG